MFKITSKNIREIFLDFFEKNRHLRISGSSIIPENDPTLLFINSGMAPLKKYFTGEAQPPNTDLCNIQPCIRTIDINETGDRHHLTSFEMLGSWSINNYFKKEAISLAYDLLVNGFCIPKDKLYVTVFSGCPELNLEPDNESAGIWANLGVNKEHIVYQPFEDNFWGPTAETGPCGPCTEVFYDTGDEYGKPYIQGGNFDTKGRYIEIWNAGVFMQFYKNSDGTYSDLKFKSVDTGAGLERLTMALNGLSSVYETDALKPIYEEVKRQGLSLSLRDVRIITDHIRTITFILSEGIKPSNDGRGYIPRRLIRKCVAITLKTKIDEYDFVSILDKVIEQYGDFYVHFKQKREEIISSFEKERLLFQHVLRDGFKKLENMCDRDITQINGRDAFILVSTYGIPIDLIKEYAMEKNITIDEEGYENEFKKHQEISKNELTGTNDEKEDMKLHIAGYDQFLVNFKATDFLGYKTEKCEARILSIFSKGQEIKNATEGQKVLIITDSTCFYAEGGGQVADVGFMRKGDSLVDIIDVQKNDKFIFAHVGVIKKGQVSTGDKIELEINTCRREKLKANHSAVHLLQSALRKTLGDSIKQAGSLVEEDRLRFDFQYDSKLSDAELNQIELLVNEYIQKDIPLETELTNLDDAISRGVLAFFEDKYGDNVRIVRFGNVSQELCGGTHINQTGKIGYFKIISEGSIGRGVRRISAITGNTAVEYIQGQIHILKEASLKLKVPSGELLTKLTSVLQTPKGQKNDFNQFTNEEIQQKIKETEKKRPYIIQKFELSSSLVRDEAIRVAEVIKGVVCFICYEGEKVHIIVATDKRISKQFNANIILQKILTYIDGKGGGQPHLAQGGGSNTNGVHKIEEDLGRIIDNL